MKQLNVTVVCSCTYNSYIMVPDEMTEEEAIAYAEEHLEDVPLGVLEYIPDSDELDKDNCDFADEDEEKECS